MKYSLTIRTLGTVLNGMVKDKIADRAVRQKIRREYKQIIRRADDIGSKNKLMTSYVLAAFFIAMNRSTSLSPQENYEILEHGMRASRLLKAFMGDSRSYFSEKNMQSRRAWSKQTHEKKYKNDWVVDVLEKTDRYRFGLDYRECGVCKLCRDEHCFELAKYMCRLDFMLVEIMGVHLERTTTLAEGGDKCDFRFSEP